MGCTILIGELVGELPLPCLVHEQSIGFSAMVHFLNGVIKIVSALDTIYISDSLKDARAGKCYSGVINHHR